MAMVGSTSVGLWGGGAPTAKWRWADLRDSAPPAPLASHPAPLDGAHMYVCTQYAASYMYLIPYCLIRDIVLGTEYIQSKKCTSYGVSGC